MTTVPPLAPQGNLKPETTFIYALIDPETNEARYVGKSNDPQERYKEHLRKDKHSHKKHWIDNLRTRGLKPILQILEEVPFEQWQEHECYWIEYYLSQGAPLTNAAPGGKGGSFNTPEVRAKVSARFKGKSSPLRGVKRPPRSPEWSDKISAAKKGKSPTSEAIAKAADLRRGQPRSPDVVAKITIANTGRKATPEARRNMQLAQQRRHQREKQNPTEVKKLPPMSEATKEKLRQANIGKKHTPEDLAKQSASQRGKKRPPRSAEHTEKLRQANIGKSPSPETREKLSKAHKGRVKSPEECKHISEAKKGKKRKPFTAQARANMGFATKRRYAMKRLPPSDSPTLWD